MCASEVVSTSPESTTANGRAVPAPPRSTAWQAAREPSIVAAGTAAALGWLPALTVVGAGGLFLVALADSGARAGAAWAEVLFWVGLAVLFVPIAARLLSEQPARGERLGLIVFLGLALYLIKVMQNPVAFTFPDELVHRYNAIQVLDKQQLFQPNALLPVTPLYPGLSAVTDALASVTGFSDFTVGLLIVGAARLILVLALFLLFEQAGRSARVAGLASVLYMANPNFLFFSSAYSYESLALPLAIMAALAAVRSEQETAVAQRVGYTLAALLGIMAVVVTHHLTAYALVAFLFALSICFRVVSRGRRLGPWLMALFALAAALAWLLFIAEFTLSYLAPVGGSALRSIINVLTGTATLRELFRNTSGQLAALWERIVGIGSVLLILFGLPFGLREIWHRHRGSPLALVLAGAVFLYLAALPLRFFPAAWETANRASEFVFLGVAFVSALALVWLCTQHRARALLQGAAVAALAVVFAGGLIAGWPPNARLAQPYVVSTGGALIEPAGVTTSKWTRSYLNSHSRFAVDPTNAHLLLSYGDQYPLTGEAHGIRSMLLAKHIDQSVVDILHLAEIRYVLQDRRMKSWDQLTGVYFDPRVSTNSAEQRWFDPSVYQKFDAPFEVSRIYDAGNIVIYDVGLLSSVLPVR